MPGSALIVGPTSVSPLPAAPGATVTVPSWKLMPSTPGTTKPPAMVTANAPVASPAAEKTAVLPAAHGAVATPPTTLGLQFGATALQAPAGAPPPAPSP